MRIIHQASDQVRSLIGAVNPSSVYSAEQSELLMNRNIPVIFQNACIEQKKGSCFAA